MSYVDAAAPFQFRRVNPFQGLMIDSAVWREAHEYHRDVMRLHHLVLHGWGILRGLGIRAGSEERTLLVDDGLGIDPAGNFVIATQRQEYRIESRVAGTIYLVLQFREVPTGPYQPVPGDGSGQPTRILEAYRIQERDRLPAEPYLELARLQFDPSGGPIAEPADPSKPGTNEIDRRYRSEMGSTAAVSELPMAATAPETSASQPVMVRGIDAPIAPTARADSASILIGIGLHAGAGWDRHADGVTYLAREVEASVSRSTRATPNVALAEADSVDMLYVSGEATLEIGDAEMAGITRLVDRGGVVLGEGCASGPDGEAGARQFALSFNEIASKIGRRLSKVERGHVMLVARHVFGTAPTGARANSLLLEDRGISYSDADYGCAWQGGPPNRPLARAAIREALEIGVNVALYRRDGH